MRPNGLSPWHAAYQQTRRWIEAGGFEALCALRFRTRPSSIAGRCVRAQRAVGERATTAQGQHGADRLCDSGEQAGPCSDRQAGRGGAGSHWCDGRGGVFDQGYTREQPAGAAEAKGIRLEVLKLPTTRCGFVLPPVALWSSGASPGQHAPAARTVTMSACLKPRLACISCPS